MDDTAPLVCKKSISARASASSWYRQGGQHNKAGGQTIDMQSSAANIFAAATNSTNINKKTYGMVRAINKTTLMRCLWY